MAILFINLVVVISILYVFFTAISISRRILYIVKLPIYISNIQLCGLMGMATNTDDNEQIEKEFCSLSSFFQEVKATWFADAEWFRELSMGMSHDYHEAIAAGSTLVRVGSKIFGERIY